MSHSAGAIYLRKHFNVDTKMAATNMAKSIHEEFTKTLQGVSWMDDKSKAAAIVKANAMNFDIGYPDELVDDYTLEEYYNGLELQSDSFLHSLLHIHKFFNERKKHRLHEPVNRTNWEQRATRITKVDAFYAVPQNTIRNFIQYNICSA